MKYLYFFLCSIVFLFTIPCNLFSQLTNRWEIADSSGIYYYNYYYNTGGNLTGIDENDIVVIGGSYWPIDYKNNRYIIKRYTERGNKKEIIYNDTVNVCQRFHSMSHPAKNFIVVVGDSNVYLGKIDKGERYKSFSLIMRTNDGGKTWERRNIDSNKSFRYISMCDSLNGIILQTDLDNQFNLKDEFYDSLLITNYGWITAYKIPVPNGAGFVFYCWCLAPQKYYLLCHSNLDDTEFIYSTTDGGVTWKQSAHFEENIHIDDVKFINDKIIFAVGNRQVGKGYIHEPSIYKSYDGGDSWLECKNVFRENEHLYYLYSIDFCDSLNGLAVGWEGKILRTSDGGDTWERENAPYEFPLATGYSTLRSVFYPKKDFAYVLWSRNYTMKFNNNKILSKPTFYGIYNSGHLPLNDINLSWTSVTGADRYWLKVDSIQKGGSTADFDLENPLIDTVLSDTNIVIKNLDYDRFYNTWVKAINDSMESDWSDANGGFATISTENELYKPNLIYPAYASRVENTNVTLRWNKVLTAERYYIIINNDDYSYSVNELITDTTFTITDLAPSSFYYVSLKSARGIQTSGEYWSYFRTRDVLGVDDEVIKWNDNVFNIYPNPFSNNINLEIEGNDRYETIFINDILGRVVYTTKTELLETGKTFNLTLATEPLPQGVYFVSVKGMEEARVVVKIE
ncbi:MAG: T9SS type A sorting domain-containing protein [Bacteroidetes bacterium]|nr:MAG: T9SS type A sorting domain-containing protein [Bacteroidota bacterium]